MGTQLNFRGGGYLGTAQNLGDDMWQGVTRYVKEDVRNKKWPKILQNEA